MKKFFSRIAKMIPALALSLGIMSVNSGCGLFYYQTQPPKAMDEYRK